MSEKLLEKLPESAKDLWQSTFKTAKAKHGESRANRIAWSAIKNRLHKVENNWIARDSDFKSYKTISYKFKPEETIISRSQDGFTYIKQPLASTDSIGGLSLSQVALKRLAEQINSEGVPGLLDPKHSFLDKNYNEDEEEDYEAKVKQLNSGVEAVDALVENNRLIATLKVRNDVLDKVTGFKAASIEARVPSDSIRAGVTDQARLASFVLTNSPADSSAVRA